MQEHESSAGTEQPKGDMPDVEREHQDVALKAAEELKGLGGQVLAEPPYAPPEQMEATEKKKLTTEFETLTQLHEALGKDVKPDDPKLAVYAEKLAAYNARCREPFQGSLKKKLSLGALSDKNFSDLLKDVRSPVDREMPTDVLTPEQIAVLNAERQELGNAQSELLQNIDNALDNERFGYETDPNEASGIRMILVEFLKLRWRYQTEIKRAEPREQPWMTLMGVAFQEVLEEAGESSLNFGKQSVFKKWFPVLDRIDTALMTKLNLGAEKAGEMLAKRGLVPPKMEEVMKTFSKMPFGKQFWEKLLTVESPVTVALFAFYLHTSKDKVKATMQFASFLATSAATTELLGIAQNVIARSQYMLIKRRLMPAGLKGTMKLMRTLPKNPAVQFAIMLGVMFGVNEILDTYVLSPAAEATSDGDMKHGFGGAVSTLSGEGLLGHGERQLQNFGLLNVNIDDEDAYLSQEYMTDDNLLNPLNGLDSRFTRTIDEWNTTIDPQIEAERTKNPLRAKMLESQRILDPQKWAQRKAATDVLPLVHYIQEKEAALLTALRAVKDGPLAKGETLHLLDYAVADTDVWDTALGSPVYTKGRNDRAIEYVVDAGVTSGSRMIKRYDPTGLGEKVFSDGSTSDSKVLTYIQTLPEKDPTRELWNDYFERCKQLGKNIALYRHLDIGYSTEKWVGDRERTTDFTREGFIEAILNTMQREQAYDFTGMTNEEAVTHATLVSDAVKVEKEQVSIASLPTEALGKFAEGTGRMAGNIGSDIWNVRGTIAGERDSSFAAEIRDATSGEYAFGDRRLNEKNAMRNTMAAAASVLPASALDTIQKDARKLAVSKDLSTVEEMTEVQRGVRQVAGEYADGSLTPEPANDSIRKALKVPNTVPVLMATNAMMDPVMAPEVFKRAFGGTEIFPSDVVILQYIQPSQGAILVNMNVVHCAASDRSAWTVDVHRVSYQSGFKKEEFKLNRTPMERIGFPEWSSRQPSLKNETSSLSTELKKQQTVEEKSQRDSEAALKKQQALDAENRKRATSSETFVELVDGQGSGEFQARVGGNLVTYRPDRSSRVSAVRTMPTGTYRSEADRTFIFTINGNAEPWIVPSLGFLKQENLTQAQKNLILDVLSTPNEKNDEEAIERVLDMCDTDFYNPNIAMRAFGYSFRNYRQELKNAVLPLYSKSIDKRAFLKKFVTELADVEAITLPLVESLPAKLAE